MATERYYRILVYARMRHDWVPVGRLRAPSPSVAIGRARLVGMIEGEVARAEPVTQRRSPAKLE